jgi:transposase
MGRKTKEVRAGIDVSAAKLVVAVRGPSGEVREYNINNDASGHKTLVSILTKARKPVYVAMEATGNYHIDAALALTAHPRIHLMVVNPKAARKFAEAQMRRAKTDHVDANVVLEFLERMEFVEWQAPAETLLQFRSLARHLTSLIEERVATKNRLTAAKATRITPSFIIDDLEEAIDQLSQRIDEVQAEALEAVQRDPNVAQKFVALTSMPGIADRAGIQILAELAMLPEDMTPDEVVAHAGLDPRPFQSGTMDLKRGISRIGNARLRGALYMPAVTASQHSPAVAAWYESLTDRNKKPLVAQVAVMRRLLRVAWVLTVRRTTWNEDLFRPKTKTKLANAKAELQRDAISP